MAQGRGATSKGQDTKRPGGPQWADALGLWEAPETAPARHEADLGREDGGAGTGGGEASRIGDTIRHPGGLSLHV